MGRPKFSVAILSLSLLANLLLVLFTLGRQNEVSVLKGGWFLPYPLTRKAPGKANDLDFCRLFRRKTYCGVEQTRSALLSVRKLALNGVANQDCVDLLRCLECSICDPKIGVQPGSPLICGHFCDRIFYAFSNAYFGGDTNTLDVDPCSARELVCVKASDLFSNGTELCNVTGFSVLPVDPGNPELSEGYYYRARDSLYSIHPFWQPSQKKKPKKSEPTGKPKCEVFNEDAPSRVKKNESFYGETPSPVKKNEVFNDGVPYRLRKIFLDRKVYCVTVLTVLAAGLFFLRFRRRDPNLERIAAILRAQENLDGVLKKNKKSRKKKNG